MCTYHMCIHIYMYTSLARFGLHPSPNRQATEPDAREIHADLGFLGEAAVGNPHVLTALVFFVEASLMLNVGPCSEILQDQLKP